jgi:hypothetical protein
MRYAGQRKSCPRDNVENIEESPVCTLGPSQDINPCSISFSWPQVNETDLRAHIAEEVSRSQRREKEIFTDDKPSKKRIEASE